MTVISLLHAPAIRCEVKDKETGEVVYSGDSNFEANEVYNKLLKEARRPVYEKEVTQLFHFPEKKKPDLGNPEVVVELLRVVPERMRSVYAAIMSGMKIEEGVQALAFKFHPEFFIK